MGPSVQDHAEMAKEITDDARASAMKAPTKHAAVKAVRAPLAKAKPTDPKAYVGVVSKPGGGYGLSGSAGARGFYERPFQFHTKDPYSGVSAPKKTKSGKQIFSHFEHPSHAGYTAQDHLDAAAAHQEHHKELRAEVKVGNTNPDLLKHHEAAYKQHWDAAQQMGATGNKLAKSGASDIKRVISKAKSLPAPEHLPTPDMVPMQKAKLVHYGRVPGLSELDSSFQGTGTRGADTKRGRTEVPRTYFYREGTPTESDVVAGAKSKYHAEVPDSDLYDIGTDQHGFGAAVQKERSEKGGSGSPFDAVLKAVQAKGYKGFYNSQTVPHMRGVVAMFGKTPVKESPIDDSLQKSISAQDIELGRGKGEKLEPAHHERLGKEYKELARIAHVAGDHSKEREFMKKAKDHLDRAPQPMEKSAARLPDGSGCMVGTVAKSGEGLYANIHARRERGLPPKKPGQEGYPTDKAFTESAKTAKSMGKSGKWDRCVQAVKKKFSKDSKAPYAICTESVEKGDLIDLKSKTNLGDLPPTPRVSDPEKAKKLIALAKKAGQKLEKGDVVDGSARFGQSESVSQSKPASVTSISSKMPPATLVQAVKRSAQRHRPLFLTRVSGAEENRPLEVHLKHMPEKQDSLPGVHVHLTGSPVAGEHGGEISPELQAHVDRAASEGKENLYVSYDGQTPQSVQGVHHQYHLVQSDNHKERQRQIRSEQRQRSPDALAMVRAAADRRSEPISEPGNTGALSIVKRLKASQQAE